MSRTQKILINSTLVIVAIIITLVVLEFALSLFGIQAILDQSFEPAIEPGIECDPEAGCFWDAAYLTRNCIENFAQNTSPQARHCYINEQGFFDSESFVDTGDLGAYRILLLGDSFTFGYTASIGSSWAEVAESQFLDLDATLWNAAIPGTATRQAIINIDRFAPILNPQLVVVGFNLNDLEDNLYPLDGWIVLDTEQPGGTWVRQYRINDNLDIEHVSPAELYYRLQGVDVTGFAGWQRSLLSTRVGSIILPRLAGLQVQGEPQNFFNRPQGWYPESLVPTEALLDELQTTVESYGAELLVLIIPDLHIARWHPMALADIAAMLQERGIAYVRVDDLTVDDDYVNENPNDPHWNNSGHSKAGQRMGACLRYLILNESMCPQAISETN